eukprot:Gb_02956 [translate_table: standard]
MEETEVEIRVSEESTKSKLGYSKKNVMYWSLLLCNCLALTVGSTAGPLLIRFYFVHGGSRRWFSSWLQTAGWPILILPLFISRNKHSNRASRISPKVFIFCSGIGVLTGLNDFAYAWAISYLPVTTSSLLISSQLGFNAVFAFLLVGQKFSPYSINSVILLTLGSVLLSFHTNGDRPRNVTHGHYVLGFVLTIASAAVYGLSLPLLELIYRTAKCRITYTLVVEMQVVMSASATVACTVGMVVNKDFQAIHGEAKGFDLGEVNYYLVVVFSAISRQLFFVGLFGVTFLATSLMSSILVTALIPVTQILGVIIFHEKFSGEKAMAMLLALWGFTSYLYGEYRKSKKSKNVQQLQPPLPEVDQQGVEVERETALVVDK